MAVATNEPPPLAAAPAADSHRRRRAARPLRSYLPAIDLRPALVVARRELAGYFATPVATVFIVVFLALAGVLTFSLGNFFARGQADLVAFFSFLPWLFLLFVPALTMRLWAEERRLGTIELLLTLPHRALAGGARQVPRRLGLLRHRAGADLPASGSRSTSWARRRTA